MSMYERRERMNARPERSAPPLGAVRRTQMITTYGVGSLVAVDERSYVISGIDAWALHDSPHVWEPRLQRLLGVESFRLPPAADPPSGDGVRATLFPEIYSCAKCRELKPFRAFGSPRGRNLCGACDEPLTPSRFVLACENGHLDDFPYFSWVHKGRPPTDSNARRRHELSLHSTGRTASLRSVVVHCSCGESASLQGAFGRNAMQSLGIRCTGRRPWLSEPGSRVECDLAPRALQRGSSAVWFPVNRSALSIPPWSATLQKRIHQHFPPLRALVESGAPEDSLTAVVESLGILTGTGFTVEDVVGAVRRRMSLEDGGATPEQFGGFEPAEDLRREEYEHLLTGTEEVGRDQDFECLRPSGGPALPRGIERSMQVTRLREVRALQAFTRLTAPDTMGRDTRPAELSTSPEGWLPAIEVSGEGVFLALDGTLLEEWENRPQVASRADRLVRAHDRVLRERARQTPGLGDPEDVESPISARYVLLHTLAHLLINEWSLDSGYPAAALRERLYVADGMAGVLIYTATSDAAGSLGGVVAKGAHDQVRSSLESALDRATWCSQDPPCMETEAGGVDGLNLAACYACSLLPETSCEVNNTFLDRAMLLGTPDDPDLGFFAATE